MEKFHNLAIIAHVDHGKTTLVNVLLQQSGVFGAHETVADRVMDRNDLEKERGITILAKCTALTWKGDRLNIVDTPGHADFGGEVERILSMVDGALLLVDASEGPMPQTKFVLTKALKLGLKPIVVINKVDRPDARVEEVINEVFDLFVALEATEEQLDFPIVYASSKEGWAAKTLEAPRVDMVPLLDLIREHVPAAAGNANAPFQMLVTILEADAYLGRVVTGRIHAGRVRQGDFIKVLTMDGEQVQDGRVTQLMGFHGIKRIPKDEAIAGDIVAIAGLEEATVSNTLCSPQNATPLPAQPIEPPTLSVTFSVNDSPLAGRDGKKVTSRVIRDRLFKEAEGNISIKVSETDGKDAFEVAGRGELQLGVLIETMRREGFEMSISRPRVLLQTDPATGARLEPIEEVLVDVEDSYVGTVVESLTQRKGEVRHMQPLESGRVRITFSIPSRGLIGYHSAFIQETRGTGILNRIFAGYGPWRGDLRGRREGVLISNGQGEAVAYAMNNLEERGILFIDPGEEIYEGMIIGENSRDNDLDVNALKAKQLTNIRAAGKDETIRLSPPKRMTLEDALSYIEDDELVEVTPTAIRLRKQFLKPTDRKKSGRNA